MSHELRRWRIDHRAGHDGTVLSHQPSALVHPGGAKAGEGVEAQDVGLVAGTESTEFGEAVVLGRAQRGHDQRVDLADPGVDGQLHAVVEMADVEQGVGLAVVGAQGDVVGPVGQHGGDEVARFWLADPWRMKIHIPLRRFSSASSSSVHSWSDSTPAAR